MTEPRRPGRVRAGRGSVVPDAEVTTYYDRPVLKEPVWTWEVPTYFFVGGLAGASSVLAAGARLTGRRSLADAAEKVALAGAAVSPLLLVSDLGRPARFLNMLRVVKPTSPMSMGSWILAAYAPAAGAAAVLGAAGRMPPVRALASAVSATLGPALVTYTAVLLADTAVPVWHDARRELPFVFAASAAASAGAAATALVPPDEAIPALRLLVAGSLLEPVAEARMGSRLGDLAAPYHHGRAGWLRRLARLLSTVGAASCVVGRRRGAAWRRVGGAMVLGASLCTRFSVVEAGRQSARDPVATIGPQRARLATG